MVTALFCILRQIEYADFIRPLTLHSSPILANVSSSSTAMVGMVISASVVRNSSLLIMLWRISPFSTAKALSSSSCWMRVRPMRSARGAKISIVSRAMRCCLSGFLMKDSVRILWVRSASLTSNTRTSSLIAIRSLRKFSACALLGDDWIAMRLSFVTPSTSVGTSPPNCWSSADSVTSQSSTVSCSNAVMMVSSSSRMSIRILATATGWVK